MEESTFGKVKEQLAEISLTSDLSPTLRALVEREVSVRNYISGSDAVELKCLPGYLFYRKTDRSQAVIMTKNHWSHQKSTPQKYAPLFDRLHEYKRKTINAVQNAKFELDVNSAYIVESLRVNEVCTPVRLATRDKRQQSETEFHANSRDLFYSYSKKRSKKQAVLFCRLCVREPHL